MNTFNQIVNQQIDASKKAVIGGLMVAGLDYYLTNGNGVMELFGTGAKLPSYLTMGFAGGLSIYGADTIRVNVLNRIFDTRKQNMLIPAETLAVGAGLTGFVLTNNILNGDAVSLMSLVVPMVVGAAGDVAADYALSFM